MPEAFGAFILGEQMTFLSSERGGTRSPELLTVQFHPQNTDIKVCLNQTSYLVLFRVLEELRVPLPLLPQFPYGFCLFVCFSDVKTLVIAVS